MSGKNFNAFAISFIGKYLNIIVQLVSVVVLARLLTPDDYGLYSITFIFTLFASLLKEFGVSGYIIKEENLTTEKLASCFCLLLLAGFLASIALFCLSVPISEFYDETSLIAMLQLLSLNVALTPFGTIVACVLRREMKFFPITLATVVSNMISVVAMVLFAYKGYGAMSLVYGALIASISNILILQGFRPKILPYLPSFRYLGDVFHYSKYSTTSNIIGQLGNYSSELIIGKLYSMQAVGILSKANSLVAMFNKFFFDALSQVISPFISELKRKNDTEIKKNISLITNIQLNFAWPFLFSLAILSEPIILLLLGNQWLAVREILIILCISRSGYSVFQHINPILMGLGLAKSIMKIEVTANVVRIIILLSTATYGINIMLISVAVVINALRFFMYLNLLKKELSISAHEYLTWLCRPLISSIIVVFPMLTVTLSIDITTFESTIAYIVTAGLSLSIWLFLLTKQEANIILNSVLKRMRTMIKR